ncbi:serine beta-lactamase-like protein LACTB, mitochondrial isoform X2 [Nematostella vectensis]|uniref:serine beta-lactamase-like protein LACTB, mitochondrial isoform X2 n=1 Tax=Nematostella vectensis TaxID=45351 RepID=UPI00138FFE82|nr:serine beta-lactamase-like protein LACTB, mitochondrial isoform X2 [Nematostella vectensis]
MFNVSKKTRLKTKNDENSSKLSCAIKEAQVYISQLQVETGTPGLVAAVSVDGTLVWSEGLGLADVENHVKCSPKSVMRIASISKSLTAAAVAKLYEEKKIDLDAPIQKYIPSFPQKELDGEVVTITTRQLLSHLGGIRHYVKAEKKSEPDQDTQTKNPGIQDLSKAGTNETRENEKNATNELENKEYYIKEPLTLLESLALFENDPLVGKPGEKYNYTTHGYTLISGVVHAAAKQDFQKYMKQLFKELGMNNTAPEHHGPITYHRARQYERKKRHGLVNVPYVDNSYKWAGGGFISTAEDLVKFGNALLYARQANDQSPPGFLKQETVKEMWALVEATRGKVGTGEKGWYGWGWYVLPESTSHVCGRHQRETIFHTGGAIGGVSVLLLQPDNRCRSSPSPPRGIVVALLMNQQEVARKISDAAENIATIFYDHLNPEKT